MKISIFDENFITNFVPKICGQYKYEWTKICGQNKTN